MKQGMGSHQSSNMTKDEWLTPPEIVKSLGDFALDPCAPINRPWETAFTHYDINIDGLSTPWVGRVWLNPPYGSETGTWLHRLYKHGDGIALIFARTETKMFFEYVWGKADAVLFIKGRLSFHHVSGKKADRNAGAPSVLVAYGKENARILKNAGILGKYINLKNN